MGFSVGCLEVSEFYSPTKIITLFLLVPTLTFYVILVGEHKNSIKADDQNITLLTKGKAKERPKTHSVHMNQRRGRASLSPDLLTGSYLTHTTPLMSSTCKS
jgi:hypothetical protein